MMAIAHEMSHRRDPNGGMPEHRIWNDNGQEWQQGAVWQWRPKCDHHRAVTTQTTKPHQWGQNNDEDNWDNDRESKHRGQRRDNDSHGTTMRKTAQRQQQ
jgi:hypothetical protein